MSALLHGGDVPVIIAPERSRASVPAVLVGAVVAVALGAAMTTLGSAIGAGLVDATARATPSATTMTVGAGAWLLLCNLVGLFVGGMVAGRLSGSRLSRDGGMHGLGVWGLSFLFALTVMGGVAGQIGGAVTSAVGGAASTAASGISSAVGAAAPSLDAEAAVNRVRLALTAPENPAQMTPEQRAAESARILANRVAQGSFPGNERTRLGQIIAAESGISPEEAGRRIDAYEAEAQRLARSAEETAREAADATAKAASLSAWWLFATMILGALAAWIGATRGAAARWDEEEGELRRRA